MKKRPLQMNEISELLCETIALAENFLKKDLYLLSLVPAEDYDNVVNVFRTATVTLQSLIRFTSFEHDEAADEIDLNELLQEIIQHKQFSDIKIKIKKLPTLHINRLRMIELFRSLLASATNSKASKIEISCSKSNQFTLSDNRPRPTKYEQKRLFCMLYFDKNKRAKSNLELFIASRILDFYESKITVTTHQKHTVFKFKLPIAPY